MARANEHADWKLPKFGEYEPSQIDWARMAAFIDGEGCIVMPPRTYHGKTGITKTISLMIHVANTDIRLVQWIKSVFGGSFVIANKGEVYKGRNVKDCWHWSTVANRAAWILHNCLPFFIIKREQAELGLALQESIKKWRWERRGSELMDESVRQERFAIKEKLSVMKKRGRIDWVAREKESAVSEAI